MASVSKADTVDAIAKATDMRKADVETVLDAFFDYVGDAAKTRRQGGMAELRKLQCEPTCGSYWSQPSDRRTGPDRRIDGDEVLGE